MKIILQNMASKLFLDANVCLDFLLQRKGFQPSEEIIKKILAGDLNGYITPSVLHIVAYYLSKVHPIDIVKKVILNLLAEVRVIECNHETAVYAINSQMTDIEDALQYYTALYHKLDYFISNDAKLTKSAIPDLPVYLPEEFLAVTGNI